MNSFRISRTVKSIDSEWASFDDCAVKNQKDPRACSDSFRALWRKYDQELQLTAGSKSTGAPRQMEEEH